MLRPLRSLVAMLALLACAQQVPAQGEIYDNNKGASKAGQLLPQSKAAAAIRARLAAKERAVLQDEVDKLRAAHQAEVEENQRLRDQAEAARQQEQQEQQALQQAQQDVESLRQRLAAAEQRASDNERRNTETGQTLADTQARIDQLTLQLDNAETALMQTRRERWQWLAMTALAAALAAGGLVRLALPRRIPVHKPMSVSATLGSWHGGVAGLASVPPASFRLRTQWLPGQARLQATDQGEPR